jgi:hypothetical protein
MALSSIKTRRIAKSLAGVLAVSIAALLFAGCGGQAGDSIQPEPQDLRCKKGYDDAATALRRSIKSIEAEESVSRSDVERKSQTYATALSTFDFAIGGLDCPTEIRAQIVKLIESDQMVVNTYRGDPSGAGWGVSNETYLAIQTATTIIRSVLGLEPLMATQKQER